MKSVIHCSAALLALASTSALAQEAGDTDTIIVTATGAPSRSADTGQAVSTLGQSEIDVRQTVGVAELLASQPGVTVSRNGGLGGFSAVRIRGAEGEQTLALIDGVKVNDPSSPGGGFDFGSLLIGNIRQIEVLRGPNSVPWGSEAIGGVANVVTATPTAQPSAKLRGEYGSNDASNIVGNLSGTLGPVRASIGAGWFNEGGISAYKNGTEADGLRQYGANGRVEIDLADGIGLDLRGYYAKSRIEQDGFPPPFYSFADTREFSRSEQTVGYAGLHANLGDLRNQLGVTLSDINRDSFAQPGDATPQYLNRGRIERIEYRGDWRASGALRAVFGAEHERSRISDGFSENRTHVSGGYLQLIASPLSRVTLTGGVRVDDHATFGTRTTLSANMVWHAGAGTTIRAAYGEGFKAPTLFQLYSFYGNVTLKPESARSYDLGVEHKLLEGALVVSATLFQRDTRNQIDFISCYARTTGICANRPDGTYDNVDRTRAKGLETSIEIRPTDTFGVTVNYTLLDTEDRTTGRVLVRRPRHNLAADVDWTTPFGARVGATLRLASDSADTDFETFARTSLDGYALAGLRASLPIGKALELYGRVENLFDARYETVSGYGTYGRTAHVGMRAAF
ncbi:MAG: TonB-dependent receptor plug domain-containing protein [Chakrabartia godavariana]